MIQPTHSWIRDFVARTYPRGLPKRLMAIDAYFDETGTDEREAAIFVGGFMADTSAWTTFETEWREVLREFNVSALHSVDFFHRSKSGERRDPYRGWTDQTALRFLVKLVDVIKDRKVLGIARGLSRKAFNMLSVEERRMLTNARQRTFPYKAKASGLWLPKTKLITSGAPGRPYFAAQRMCIRLATLYTPAGETVNFVFDRQDQFAPLAHIQFNELRDFLRPTESRKLGDLVYSDKTQATPLQLADLLCYGLNVAHSPRTRISAELLHVLDRIERIPADIKYWDNTEDMRRTLTRSSRLVKHIR